MSRHNGDISPRTVLAALLLASFTYAYQQTAVDPSIEMIEGSLQASVEWSAWLLNGYLMVATLLAPTFGRLGDLRGKARAMLVAPLLFFVGSLGAAVVPGLFAVLFSGALQGDGGAVLPLAFAISRRHLDDGRVNGAVAAITGSFGLGAILGFSTGGLISTELSWRFVFGIGAALSLLAVAIFVVSTPRPRGFAGW